MYRPILFLFGLCLLGTLPAVAQQTISGTVTDDADPPQPLVGVSVYIKGSPNVGTITDYNGAFSISVEESAAALVFSYVGYNRLEIPIKGRRTIDVRMREAAEVLDKIVVTAVGIERSEKSLGLLGRRSRRATIGRCPREQPRQCPEF